MTTVSSAAFTLYQMDMGNQIQEESKELTWKQRRLERIKEYIDENLWTDLSAAKVSEKFDVSVSTLHHNFRKYLSESFQQYVEKVRMRKAMEMTRSGKRIRDIIVATGYKRRATFNSAFKRTFKHPPGTFKYDCQ